MDGKDASPQSESLLSVIELQNELVAADRPFEQVLDLVCERARELAGADGARIEMIEEGRAVEVSVSGRLHAEPVSAAGIPIRHGDQVAGMITVQAARTARFDSEHFRALGLLAEVIAVRLSTGTVTGTRRVDELTGLPNRRMFAERLTIEAGRARRYEHPLALCIFELQGLERVYSELGASVGADAVRRAGKLLTGGRLGDECFRLGGYQFALLMPQTTLDGAEAAGARLTASIVAAGLADGRVTACFGAASGTGDAVALHEEAGERLRLAQKRRAARRSQPQRSRQPRVVAVVRGRTLPEPA